MTRVIVADDHPAFLLGLSLALSQHELRIVGRVASGDALVQLALEQRPDVVITDVRMPGMSGIQAIRELKSSGFSGATIVLSTYDDDATKQACREAGANAFLSKDVATSEVARITHLLVANPSLSLIREVAVPRFTERELEVLQHLAQGRTNKQIAQALLISAETVKDYCTSVFAKLGVSDRLGAVAAARRIGIIKDHELP